MSVERGLQTYNKVSTKQLTTTGVLIALNLVLNQLTISFGTMLEIGLAFLPIAVLAYMYGPMNAGIAASVADVFGFILRPNGFFFPGFTLNACIMGIIYGIILHKKKITLLRVALATLLVTIIVNLILTPIWLNIMYGSALFAVPRVVKAVLLYPVEVGLLYTLLANFKKLELRRKNG
ncbi:folate family ECF transporter S component [Lentibacillus saliphilus]|uniref:folate family ECF transporter S component n=1 Tax=Lentibacillus saliphilus TaxID=2737028 RepID=UPI001C2F7CBD